MQIETVHRSHQGTRPGLAPADLGGEPFDLEQGV
jgi:hypothetical protein